MFFFLLFFLLCVEQRGISDIFIAYFQFPYYPLRMSSALISSYFGAREMNAEQLTRAAALARQPPTPTSLYHRSSLCIPLGNSLMFCGTTGTLCLRFYYCCSSYSLLDWFCHVVLCLSISFFSFCPSSSSFFSFSLSFIPLRLLLFLLILDFAIQLLPYHRVGTQWVLPSV